MSDGIVPISHTKLKVEVASLRHVRIELNNRDQEEEG